MTPAAAIYESLSLPAGASRFYPYTASISKRAIYRTSRANLQKPLALRHRVDLGQRLLTHAFVSIVPKGEAQI